MSRRCANAACEYPAAACLRRGEFPDPEQCEDWLAGPGEASTEPSPSPDLPAAAPTPEGPRRLWSGHALGSAEAAALMLDAPTSLVVVAGAEDAGKTCLLVSQFLEIAQGRTPGFPYRFCGSRTLRAYERLADLAWEWSGAPEDRVLPRTASGSHREPGFMHLAFKPRVGGESQAVIERRRDVLLTDLPGEWFGRWAVQAEAGRKSMPFMSTATAFWVVVDAPRILAERLAFRETEDLLGRVVAEAGPHQRIDLILCKVDALKIAPEPGQEGVPAAWGALHRRMNTLLTQLATHRGPTTIHAISAFPGRVGEQPPRQVLAPLVEPQPPAWPPSPRTGDRYFHLYREESP